MVARVSIQFPPAGQANPDAESREKGLRELRLELEAQIDAPLRALLAHEVARLHERRDDLAAAARDELSATKHAAGFVEPLEALVGIATRSHSKANLTRLLERLAKLSRSDDEHLRAALALAQTQFSTGDVSAAQTTIESALERAPSSGELWLALELLAGSDGDRPLMLKAALGRAAHARNPDLRCLLFERVARLQAEAGDSEAAFDSLRQSIDEVPTWRALRAWEHLAAKLQDFPQAVQAAAQTATILRAALEEPEEAMLYKVPHLELSEERAFSAQVRAAWYALRNDDEAEAESLVVQLIDQCASPAALSLGASLAEKANDLSSFVQRLVDLEKSREWDASSRGLLKSIAWLAAVKSEQPELYSDASASLAESSPDTSFSRLASWTSAEQADDLAALLSLCTELSTDSDAYRLGEQLLLLLTGQLDEARGRLPEGALDDLGGSSLALHHLVARLDGSTERETAVLEEVLKRADETAKPSLALELVRQDLLQGADAETATLRLERDDSPLDAWDGLVARLLSPGELSAKVEPLQAPSNAWKNAVSALRLEASLPVADSLSAPFALGARLAQSGKQDEAPDALLSESSENLNDEVLVRSFRIRLLLSALQRSTTHDGDEGREECLSLAKAAGATGSAAAKKMESWVRYLAASGDPKALTDYLEETGERTLLKSIIHLSEDVSAAHISLAKPTTDAERLLRALCARATEPSVVGAELDEVEFLSTGEKAALQLSTTGSGLLDEARFWNEENDHDTSRFARWFAAARENDREATDTALLALGKVHPDLGLCNLLVAKNLSLASQQEWSTQIASQLSPEHGDEGSASDEESKSPARSAAAAAWAQAEWSDWDLTEDGATVTSTLADELDASLTDPDAQLAALVSGYQLLVAGAYEAALTAFERLYQVMPSDLTVCQGLRLAAERTQRPELEVLATCELARNAEDNRASAALWERAGILYQDALSLPADAEECFTAALVRSPGSPTSFERVYRFARSRGDRKRQVELLDARLDTAESETLRIEIFWEKARYCRMLGKRSSALRALEQLLLLAPDHLPSLALAAELHLVDNQTDRAAEALRKVASHPDTPDAERKRAGLFACDLFEQLHRPRDAVELLQSLESFGVQTLAAVEKRARSHARSGDWGEAYRAFSELNDEQDSIDLRLESARMMLAIQRDHLRQPDELKDAARRVLRDHPDDDDAASVVLEANFSVEERSRLLLPTRENTRRALRGSPLDPEEIERYALLCEECGDDVQERVSLGLRALTGKLPDAAQDRLSHLREHCPILPNHPWSSADRQHLSDPAQLGGLTALIELTTPYLSKALEPSLQTLGVTGLMRVDEFSDSEARTALATWMGALGLSDFELYIGGTDPDAIRALNGELPTIVLGGNVSVPLSRTDQARLVAQLSSLETGCAVLLNQPAGTTQRWLAALLVLSSSDSIANAPEDVEEKARALSNAIAREQREEIAELCGELTQAGIDITELPFLVRNSACRAAVLAYGDATIVRQLPDLLSDNDERRSHMMTQLVKFSLSEEFSGLRMKAGLERA